MTGSNHCAHVFTWYELKMSQGETLSDGELFAMLGEALMYLTASH